jgi:hypothetical protein
LRFLSPATNSFKDFDVPTTPVRSSGKRFNPNKATTVADLKKRLGLNLTKKRF